MFFGGDKTEDGLDERFADSIKLFEYAYNNFNLTHLKSAGDTVKTVEIKNGTKDTRNLSLNVKDEINVVNNIETDVKSITPTISLNEPLLAPINEGDIVGKITYKIDDVEYSSVLTAGNTVEKKMSLSLILIIIGAVLLVFAGIIMPRNKRKSRKRRYKR